MFLKFQFCPHYWSNPYFTLGSYQTHAISQKWLCLLQVLLALYVLNRIQGINWTCKQHDALFSNLKNIWLCSGVSGSVTSRKISGKVNMKAFEQNFKNYVGIYVWRCGSSELWRSVTGQGVPAILKQAVKKSFLDWMHLKIKDTMITHNIGHHSSSDKVSTSQKNWVLKSTTVRSSNFTYYW